MACSSEAPAPELLLFGVRVKVDQMRKSVSLNNLSEYLPDGVNADDTNKNDEGLPKTVVEDRVVADYPSADDAEPQPSNGNRERKRGFPWSEEEHKLFLVGLQKVRKGDWKGISKNYVKTRTPTQVASHAQKYFIRRSNQNRRRRRSSLCDITTEAIASMTIEEGTNHPNSAIQSVLPSTPPLPAISNTNRIAAVPVPVTGSVSFPMPKGPTRDQTDGANTSSAMLIVQFAPFLCLCPRQW